MIGYMTLRRRSRDLNPLVAPVPDADEMVARSIVRACLQPGLPTVHRELAGLEVCARPAGELTGLRYGDALHRFGTSALIGVGGVLNPPMERPIEGSDELIVLGAGGPDGEPEILAAAIVEAEPPVVAPQRVMVLGWNRRGVAVVRHIDRCVPSGSRLDIVAAEPDAKAELDLLRPGLRNLELSFTLADTELESFDPGRHDRVIVLSYDEDHTDGRALITLLRLCEAGVRCPVVASNLNDGRNRSLVGALADVVVAREITDPLTAFLDRDGIEIRLPAAGCYVREDLELTFHTVVEAARRRGETAIGYQVARPSFVGVVLNPDKSLPLTFGPDDRLIVLAETG